MKTVAFTEFRQNASRLFSEIEKGEVLVVMRHGKPIAKVSPAEAMPDEIPSWKKPGLQLSAKGAGLSAAILEERSRENVL